MADALVSAVLEKLTTIILEEARQKARLIEGAQEEIDKIRSNLESVHALLDDAEERETRDKSIKLWLHRLKEASIDMEDVLDEWNTALLKWKMNKAQNSVSVLQKKVCHFISCFCSRPVVKLHGVAVQIKKINGRLDEIAKQKDRYSFVSREIRQPQIQPERETTSFTDGSVIYGRDEGWEVLARQLLHKSSTMMIKLRHTLTRGFGRVSDLFDEARVARAIIIELEGQAHSSVFLLNSLPLQSLLKRICDSLGGKKFFLVLDDVWTEDDESWDSLKQSFKHGAPGSRILVTTRKDTVVEIMESSHVFRLEELSQEVCWSILSQIALINRDKKQCSDLNDIGWKIAKKCKGLPLAAKTLGSLLRYKRTREEWKDVLDNEIWASEMIQKDIFAPLLLSYYDLPSVIRQCFLYSAIFPKDFEIWRYLVIQHWMAQGYLNSSANALMELVGREYFDYLTARCFFQDFGKLEDGCRRLEELPAGIGKLINLRFFRAAGCFDLTWYPKSMGGLASLRELVEVNIRVDHNDPKEFCIGDLEKLRHLRRLWVKFVGYTIDADEVRRARLHEKIHLQEMKIDLDQNMDEACAVETLNPPPNLNVQFWTSYTDWYY
ncbi:hypothetical protein SLEP1_g19027 [Rubroshorea leprosula]|nr:hypothetical protein SLEP1_g19027 [Rubroshorea leprosula]